jgi:hypothetical protein
MGGPCRRGELADGRLVAEVDAVEHADGEVERPAGPAAEIVGDLDERSVGRVEIGRAPSTLR